MNPVPGFSIAHHGELSLRGRKLWLMHVHLNHMQSNARSESIHEKPTFRHAFRTSRCLIPATGYYEWATSLGKYAPKQPFYISRVDKMPTFYRRYLE